MASKVTYIVPEGTEDEHAKFIEYQTKVDKAWKRLGEFKEGSAKYQKVLREIDLATTSMFAYFDRWAQKVKHRFDDVLAPEDDVRAVVIDSLSDKMDEIQFNLGSGLLGSKIAQAIRELTIEEEVGIPPLCADCA